MEVLQAALSMGQPSLYAQFAKELHGLDTLEYDWGFATYELGPDYVYIVDIYVVPEERANKKGIQLMHQIESIAKTRGATKMYGSVPARDNDQSEASYKMLQHLGFCDSHVDSENIYLVRDI